MHGFSFQYPYLLLLLLVLAGCAFFCKAKTQSFYIPHLRYVMQTQKIPVKLDKIVQYLSLSCLIIAAASPVLHRGWMYDQTQGRDIVLSIDLSESMLAPMQKGAAQTRFDALQEVVAEFIDKRKTDRVGIVSFGSNAAVTSPITYDKQLLQQMLSQQYVGALGGKTALYDALFQTYLLLDESDADTKTVVLFTDGVNNSGTLTQSAIEQIVQESSIKLYIVALARVNHNLLEGLAAASEGKYFYVQDKKELAQVYAHIDALEKSLRQGEPKERVEYLYIYFLFAALIGFFSYLYLKKQRGL
ncbi:MAG: vWA domain-containing protein [Campylobacterota bacterium]